MNYGRYFRLNQSLSKVVDGIAIYDYIDLPAYFGPSVDNPMSPKYPISVTITSDSVCFRLHYSAFKLEKRDSFDESINKIEDKQKREEFIALGKHYPRYAYDRDDINKKSLAKIETTGLTDAAMAHMEEVILELPYTDKTSTKLSDTLKGIYNTKFPLQEKDNDDNISYGGRFIEQLIQKRYPGYIRSNEEVKKLSLEEKLYHMLQVISDNTASFSSLWLMGLFKKEQDGNAIYLYDKKKRVIGFLRKLLLDFLFDLKHSDVFQNSANYQKMYSGLMSDFYFSALMHKCEYYYYRKLTSKAIEDNEKEDKTISKEENKKRIEEGKKAIASLYANELIKAEDLWIQDIMNPHAGKDFEHKYPGKHNLLRDIFEYYSFKQWPSWFAEPEEEMRRVCFTMKDETGEKHICNSDTLVRYLKLQAKGEEASIVKMIELRNDGKEKISKWFLKQYAFSDVLHLHLFKHANSILLLLLAIPLLLSLFLRGKLIDYYFYYLLQEAVVVFAIFAISFVVGWIEEKTSNRSTTRLKYHHKVKKDITPIVKTRRITIKERGVFLLIILASIILVLLKEYNHDRLPEIPLWVLWAIPVSFLLYAFYKRRRIKGVLPEIIRDMISCLHLFLPRLVASITLAWITLSMGFDLYVSFFDASPQTGYIIGICVIVTLFVMYSINKVIPHSPPLRKLLRSLELMVISYFISLSVGFVIINFLGEKYLERGGYIGDYYAQHVDNSNKDSLYWVDIKENEADLVGESVIDTCCIKDKGIELYVIRKLEDNSTSISKKQVDDLKRVHFNEEHYIAAEEQFWGIHIFILRDFLIMFSFIAMFTGIFIQLIIFGDNKQMTEL